MRGQSSGTLPPHIEAVGLMTAKSFDQWEDPTRQGDLAPTRRTSYQP